MSDVNALVVEPLTKFFKDSAYLIKKCSKPDRKGKIQDASTRQVNRCLFRNTFHLFSSFIFFLFLEFARIARATGIGFLIMGFVGFFVKLVHIPINNILVGGM